MHFSLRMEQSGVLASISNLIQAVPLAIAKLSRLPLFQITEGAPLELLPYTNSFYFVPSVPLCESPSTQTSPSSNTSFFQMGTVRFNSRITHSQASKAAPRWCELTEITTLVSPISRRPVRCTIPT